MRTRPFTFVSNTASSSSSLDSSNGYAAEREPGVVEEDVDAAELLDRVATKRSQLSGIA